MNTNPIVLSALADTNIPVKPIDYKGEETDYIVFNDSDNRAIAYADDVDTLESAIVQVHYYTQGNPKAKAKDIRKALRQYGFIYLKTTEFYEADEQYYHTIIEVRYDGISETQLDNY